MSINVPCWAGNLSLISWGNFQLKPCDMCWLLKISAFIISEQAFWVTAWNSTLISLKARIQRKRANVPGQGQAESDTAGLAHLACCPEPWADLQFYKACVCESLSRVWVYGDPMNCSPPGFSVRGILQTRILERVAMTFFKGSSQPRDWTQISCIAGRLSTIWATKEACNL